MRLSADCSWAISNAALPTINRAGTPRQGRRTGGIFRKRSGFHRKKLPEKAHPSPRRARFRRHAAFLPLRAAGRARAGRGSSSKCRNTGSLGLLRSLPAGSQVVGQGRGAAAFDLQCPMLSLPLACGTTTSCGGSRQRALPACGRGPQAAVWSARLAAMGSPASSRGPGRGRKPPTRSRGPFLSLRWRRCLRCRTAFVSLQKDVRRGDLAILRRSGMMT